MRAGTDELLKLFVIPAIEKKVFRFAVKHAVFLFMRLAWNVWKKRAHFAGQSWHYRWRVLLLNFKTHIGQSSLFWDPLFAHITKRFPRETDQEYDDPIWDIIIPPGFVALIWIESYIPSHEGVFCDLIPNLNKENG